MLPQCTHWKWIVEIIMQCVPTDCERSEPPSQFNGQEFRYSIYIYILGRMSCRKCFHVVLNIFPT